MHVSAVCFSVILHKTFCSSLCLLYTCEKYARTHRKKLLLILLNKGKFLRYISCNMNETSAHTKKFMILVFLKASYYRHQIILNEPGKKHKRGKICVCVQYLTFIYNKNVFNFHNKKEIIKLFHCTWAKIV